MIYSPDDVKRMLDQLWLKLEVRSWLHHNYSDPRIPADPAVYMKAVVEEIDKLKAQV